MVSARVEGKRHSQPLSSWLGNVNWYNLFEQQLASSELKFKVHLPIDPALLCRLFALNCLLSTLHHHHPLLKSLHHRRKARTPIPQKPHPNWLSYSSKEEPCRQGTERSLHYLPDTLEDERQVDAPGKLLRATHNALHIEPYWELWESWKVQQFSSGLVRITHSGASGWDSIYFFPDLCCPRFAKDG